MKIVNPFLPNPQLWLMLWMILPLQRVLPLTLWLGLLCAVLVVRVLPAQWLRKSTLLIALILSVGVGMIFLLSQPLLRGENLLALLALVAVAKQFEVRTYRDRQVLVFAVFITTAFNLIYWNNLLSLMHVLVLMWLIVLTYQSPLQAVLTNRSSNPLKHRAAFELLFWSAPLAMICFLFLPRIPGPIWNFGLVFGMPLKVFEKVENVSLASGQLADSISTRKRIQEKVILVAEFDGGVPLKSRLYWRGAAFTQPLQGMWIPASASMNRAARMRNAWRDQNAYQAALSDQRSAVSYKVKVAANDSNFLYGLDGIDKNAQESYVSQYFQLMSIRPIKQEFQYQATGHLEFNFHGNPPQMPYKGTIPDSISTELTAFIARLQQAISGLEPRDQEAQILRLLAEEEALLASQRFMYGAPSDAESNSLLLHKLGYYMLALQQVDIPTRMLNGYRGGDLVALTDFIVVREKHAHVWLEQWHPESGWQRLDLQDIWRQKQTAKAAQKSAKKAPKDVKKSTPEQQKSAQKMEKEADEKVKEKDWLDSIEAWFLGYAPVIETDKSEKALDDEAPSQQPWWLFSVTIVVWAGGFIFIWRRRHRQDPVLQHWHKFTKKLAVQGYQLQPWQCHSHLREQLYTKNPPWRDVALDIISQWEAINYQDNASLRAKFPAVVTRFTAALH